MDEMPSEEMSPRRQALQEILELLSELEVAPHRPQPPAEASPVGEGAEASPVAEEAPPQLGEGEDIEGLKAKLAALLSG